MALTKEYSFSSERLKCRGIIGDDAEKIVQWRSDPANHRNFFNARPVSIDEHLSWFVNYLNDKTRYDFMILDNAERRIGTCGLSNITTDSCEISYMIGEKTARGKGYASEVVRALSDIAFRELSVREVIARIRPDNEASMHVVLAGGFTEVERVFKIEKSGKVG